MLPAAGPGTGLDLRGGGTTPSRSAPNVVLRPGGLGRPDETGSWNGATPFGTCPGDTPAVRWGRLYVLFANGPTRHAPSGTWHLFAYQVDTIQRAKVGPRYHGPAPPAATITGLTAGAVCGE